MGDQTRISRNATGDGADPGNVLFDIWLVSRATNALLDKVVQSSGLNADEFAIYSVLASGEGLTPTELGHWMSAPATTVSSYVKRFEARGHVQRAENPADGRSYLVQLTAEGRQAHIAAGVLFAPGLAEVNDELGDDLDETRHHIRQLHRIVAARHQQVNRPADETPSNR